MLEPAPRDAIFSLSDEVNQRLQQFMQATALDASTVVDRSLQMFFDSQPEAVIVRNIRLLDAENAPLNQEPVNLFSSGMVFSYEQSLPDWRLALGERPRVLIVRFVERSQAYDTKLMFQVIGTSPEAIGWSSGTVFIDLQTAERILGNKLKLIA